MTQESNERKSQIRLVTGIGLILNLGLSVVKLSIGFVAGSQALVADGVHSFSDLVSDIAILVGVGHWMKPPDASHPHGHGSLENLVTLLVGLCLLLVGVGMASKALWSLNTNGGPEPEIGAFLVAILSIVTKEALYRYTLAKSESLKSVPLRANAWHHRSDALSSIPVAIAIALAMLGNTWQFVDSVAALMVAAIILKESLAIIWPSLRKLTDQGVNADELKAYEESCYQVDGVRNVHKLRTRYCGCTTVTLDLHMEVDENLSVRAGHDIADALVEKLKDEHTGLVDVVVHIEPYSSESS